MGDDAKSFALGCFGETSVQTHELQRSTELFLNMQCRAELSSVGRPKRMPCQHRHRTRPHGQHLDHFVPSRAESVQATHDAAALLPRQIAIARTPLHGTGDLCSRPCPGSDDAVLTQPQRPAARPRQLHHTRRPRNRPLPSNRHSHPGRDLTTRVSPNPGVIQSASGFRSLSSLWRRRFAL